MAAALDGRMPGHHVDADRALAYALLASVALHAALVAALHAPRTSAQQSAQSPAPLVAYLEPAQAAPASAPRPATPSARLEAKVPARAPGNRSASRAEAVHPVAARHEEAAQARTKPPKRTAQVTAEKSDSATARYASAAAASRALATPRTEGAREARATPSPAAPANQAAALEQYRSALITEARRYQEYPLVALDNDWRGKVEVRMAVAASGALASLSVGRGSGHAVLDQQALEMIRKAKPFAPIPAALRGRRFTLDIPVIFELREPRA